MRCRRRPAAASTCSSSSTTPSFSAVGVWWALTLFETPNHPFAPEQLTLTKEGNMFTAQWNAPAGNAPTGYNIWMNETLVDENSNETSLTFSIAPGEDFHCVQVQAAANWLKPLETLSKSL